MEFDSKAWSEAFGRIVTIASRKDSDDTPFLKTIIKECSLEEIKRSQMKSKVPEAFLSDQLFFEKAGIKKSDFFKLAKDEQDNVRLTLFRV